MPSYCLLFKTARDLLINRPINNQFYKKRRKATISDLPTECMQQIFYYIQTQEEGIYPALLVSRYWCRNIVPLLWEHPFRRFSKEYHSQPNKNSKNRILRVYQRSNNKLLSTLFSCLSEQDNLLLASQLSRLQHRIKVPQSQQTLFNYPCYLQEFSYSDLELIILSYLQRWYTNDSHEFFYPQIRLISTFLCKLFFQKSNLNSLYFEKIFPELDIPNFIEIDNKHFVFSSITRFTFTYSDPITQNILNFLKIVSNFCTHIDFLEFKLKSSDYNIDVKEAIVKIIGSQNCLKHFSIEHITKDGVEPIIFSLKNHTRSLVSLRLSHVQFTESCISLISQFNNLNSLILDNCEGLSNEILYSHFLLSKLIINSQQQDITLPLLKKFGKNLKSLGLSIYDLEIADKLLSFCPQVNKIYLNIYVETTEKCCDYEELKKMEESWKNVIKSAYPHRSISLPISFF
ncbi:hypothetical protein RclHR1_00200043 [Rhizophagus clarus]|uniref:F-box domain-containing protein n=1 Tax=Rhizophagus clarus TaxID=94130 RepID=A0A2Z6QQQ3_9GLOM|nr:hypothetical protein RclHR1_00200043 [Rhizophagus clarus]GES99462.1 hypothetical protein GLOIN_2v1870862 [Rhizophagus clarus]